MISELARLFSGYVKIELKGEDRVKFLNYLIKNGFTFWDYSLKEDSILISMKIYDYKKIIKLRRGYKIKIIRLKSKGLPFKLAPYKKRTGLIFGLVFGIAVAFFMSGRVWVLTSEGSVIHSEEAILQAAKEIGIEIGSKRNDIDPHMAAIKLQISLKETDFISVNTDGVSVNIVVKDSVPKPEIYETPDDKPQNIIAKRDGVIKEIEAYDGMIKVKVGEAVKKGDLLITGLWDTVDKWGVKTGKSFSSKARGKIMAETRYEFIYKIKLSDTLYLKGKESYKYTLNFFGLKLPLSYPILKNSEYEKSEIIDTLYLSGVKMPISLVKEIYKEKTKTQLNLTEKEAENILRNKYDLDKNEKINNFSSLINEEIDVYKENGELILKAVCIFLEDIGEESQILFENE